MRRIYRLLLKFYPVRFREEYAGPMERQFGDEYREARGPAGRAWLGLRALADLVVTWPVQLIHEMGLDLRFAAQVYRRRSLVTALALAALALAIGATTGVFSVLNALLIRSLPFGEPERLVELRNSPLNVAQGRAAFHEWRYSSPYLDDAAGFATNEMNLNHPRGSVRVRVTETTANFLRMLATEPEFGRGFSVDEDMPGRDAVAVIGHSLWQNSFGGDPGALGSTIRINGTALTVVGVAPPGLDYPDKTAIWTPTIYDLERIPKAGAFGWRTIGRLRQGVTVEQASTLFQADVVRASGGRSRPRVEGFSNAPLLTLLRDQLAGPVRSASLVLMGLVSFVLLIACANVAHLLLSRTAERSYELSIRAALGASKARLMQQMVTEATVLTATAAAVGMAVAYWIAQLASTAQPSQLSARQYTVLDWRVISFAAGLAVLTGLVFGVLPASLISRIQPGHFDLRAHAGSSGLGVKRMRGVLLALQAAVTVVLASGAFSMARSFIRLLDTDLAFRTDRVVTLNVSMAGTSYETGHRLRQYYREALEQLRATPGVESSAAVSNLPLIATMFMGGRYKLDSGEQGPMAVLIGASPGYFRTIGTELLDGREFNASDREEAERVVIISEDLARSFGRGRIVGRKLNLAWRGAPQMATIVGVARSQRFAGPSAIGTAQVFRPIDQSPPGSLTFIAKVRGDAGAYLAACRDAVQRTDRSIPVYDVKWLDQRLADVLARPRFYTTAIVGFAGFALLLAVVGTYGVAVHSVAQRTHEIGVRIAVGASILRLRGMVFRQTMIPVGLGMLAGLAGASGLDRILKHLSNDAEHAGLLICVTAALVLATSTGVAVWSATGRIVHLDPNTSLRVE